ncbi:MAG: hypothetical protein OXU73_01205 [Candidatus Campbellbacteria bacterium]|nr:hypothetical protein [Candidatus Campbellbacteria bacterium]
MEAVAGELTQMFGQVTLSLPEGGQSLFLKGGVGGTTLEGCAGRKDSSLDSDPCENTPQHSLGKLDPHSTTLYLCEKCLQTFFAKVEGEGEAKANEWLSLFDRIKEDKSGLTVY